MCATTVTMTRGGRVVIWRDFDNSLIGYCRLECRPFSKSYLMVSMGVPLAAALESVGRSIYVLASFSMQIADTVSLDVEVAAEESTRRKLRAAQTRSWSKFCPMLLESWILQLFSGANVLRPFFLRLGIAEHLCQATRPATVLRRTARSAAKMI